MLEAGITVSRGDNEIRADFARHFEDAVENEVVPHDDIRRQLWRYLRAANVFELSL
jgi:hypothetical protein